ncbi:MAG: CvpA family protein [Bacteroidota bacterium]|nr:CvpA family protein [Bacteroidota bacterium]
MENVNTIDLIFLIPLVIFLILGFRKGAIVEMFTLIALFIATIGCLTITNKIVLLLGIQQSTWWVPYLAYIVVFIGIYFLIHWVGKLLEKFIKIAQLNLINGLAGALIGAFKIIFIFSLILWISEQSKILPLKFKEKSMLFQYVEPIAPTTINFISDNLSVFKGLVSDVEGYFEEINFEKRDS